MSTRKLFKDSITPLPVERGTIHNGLMINALESEHKDEKLSLLFSIEMPKESQAALEEMVAKGETISPDELTKSYSAQETDTIALTTWLKKQGFEIEQVSKDHTSVYAKGTVEQIEKNLQVNMIRVTKNGITYTAASDAPSLPSDVGENVHAIIGLQPFRQMYKNFRKYNLVHDSSLSVSAADAVALKKDAGKEKGKKIAAGKQSLKVKFAPPYLVSEIMKAYDANNLTVTGKGQTIAILIDTFPADADLKKFWKDNGLPVTISQIEKVNVKEGSLPAMEGEETLDAQWSSGIAPGATIRIYASGSLNFVDLDKALDRIIADLATHPGMRQLSISLGLGETYMGGSSGEVATQHNKFLKLAAAGVNVFVSSGDAGSNPDDSGHGANGPLQAEYESSDSSVIGVGGTTMSMNTSGTVTSETAWPGSGGGKSKFFTRPVWQKGTGVPAGTERLVPDVSMAADPNKGAYVIFQGKTLQYGGTSWSAPVWAGICALINEARANAGKPFLPFLNPLIYPLIGTNCFRDVKSGSNGNYQAATGYDMVTGIGVPSVKNLILALTK